ncbi:MAG TPA: glycosyltransferase family 2 protein [Paracoccus sp. (in: a-proteobacteria)]|nr:glycosyltransferase family 2 protein [Paracoccus sp. (in: a-proteobacteria)]
MTRAPLAFVTMVRGDHAMLDKWVGHHAALAGGRDALTVISHGADPRHDRLARGCSRLTIPFDPAGDGFEPRRMALLHGLVAGLTGYFRHVVVLDCDEFLIAGPQLSGSLADHLDCRAFEGVALSPVGLDLIHRPSLEPEALDLTRPVIGQRRHGVLHAAYSKPCIFRAPPPAGGNQHRLKGQPWQIDPDLMLVHLRHADRGMATRTGRARMRTVAAFDAAGSDHRIGTWSDRLVRLESAIARVESSPCPDLTRADLTGFAARQRAIHDERGGALDWKRGQSAPLRLPDSYLGRV